MLPAVLAITHTLTSGLPTYDSGFFPPLLLLFAFPKREMVTQHGGECGIIFLSGLAAKGLKGAMAFLSGVYEERMRLVGDFHWLWMVSAL